VAIRGSASVLPSGSLRMRGGRVQLKVGSPIPTEGRSPEEREQLAELVHQEVKRLLQTLPESSDAPDTAASEPT
jgi:1-acyl-sn-glycerol-3-phosphate acyltransferase